MTSMTPIVLKPNDRVVFGQSAAFLFKEKDKQSGSEVPDTQENPISFEFAMKEKQNNQDLAAAAAKEAEEAQLKAETDAKLKALNDKMAAERA